MCQINSIKLKSAVHVESTEPPSSPEGSTFVEEMIVEDMEDVLEHKYHVDEIREQPKQRQKERARLNDELKCPICQADFECEEEYERHIKNHYEGQKVTMDF